MEMRLDKLAALAILALLADCGPGALVDPVLSVTLSPTSVPDDGQEADVKVTALDELGQPGQGEVTLTAEIGVLANGVSPVALTLDSKGTAFTVYTCSAAVDPRCTGSTVIAAQWKVKRLSGATTAVNATKNVPVVGATGTGGGGGSGGGSQVPSFDKCATGSNAIYFSASKSGRLVQNQLFITDGQFQATTFSSATVAANSLIQVNVSPTDPAQGFVWELGFRSNSATVPLATGDSISGAHQSGYPGLEFQSATCPGSIGSFKVERFSEIPGVRITEFGASFEHSCDGSAVNRVVGCVHVTQ